ncbi:MAG: neutral/alkaline non-lysosomal ceramidase N-terminal domain-containing protein [Gammaproteobacteria bacterium]
MRSADSMAGFTAGAAESVVNPPAGAPLLGTLQRSTGVNDDLYARALVLADGTRRVAILSFDLIGMDFSLADEIRSSIEQRTGIGDVLLNCSHNHSAPFTIPWSVLGAQWLSGIGMHWRRELIATAAALVARAAASAGPVTLHSGRAPVQIGSNRRLPTPEGVVMKPNPQGSVVPWVDVLRIDRVDGKPAAVLFGHAAHPVIIHGSSQLVSAEFPGFAATALKEKLGRDVIPFFIQGCAGDINGDPLRGGIDGAERAGRALAEATYQALQRSEPVTGRELSSRSVRAELPLAPLPPLAECERLLRDAEQRVMQRCGSLELSDSLLWDLQDEVPAPKSDAGAGKADDTQPMAEQPWWLMDNVLCLRDLLKKIRAADETPLRFDAHLLQIGDDWSLLTASHELFSEYQLWADRELPSRHKMFAAYTNGCESYVPLDRDYALGGYEAVNFPSLDGAGFKYKHRRALRSGTEQKVIETLRSLWR